MAETPAGARRAPEGSGSSGGGHEAAPVTLDPLYAQTLSLMQQGRWREADRTLEALEERYPGCAELREARQRLALHLSAEGSWVNRAGSRLDMLKVPAIRRLVLANLVLYFLLGAIWLLSR